MWGALLAVLILGSIFRSDLFWEFVTGLALFGIPLGIAAGEWATAGFSAALLVGCFFYWGHEG